MSSIEEFEEKILDFHSINDEVRVSADQFLNEMREENPLHFFHLLIEVIQISDSPVVIETVTVLIYSMCAHTSIWEDTSAIGELIEPFCKSLHIMLQNNFDLPIAVIHNFELATALSINQIHQAAPEVCDMQNFLIQLSQENEQFIKPVLRILSELFLISHDFCNFQLDQLLEMCPPTSTDVDQISLYFSILIHAPFDEQTSQYLAEALPQILENIKNSEEKSKIEHFQTLLTFTEINHSFILEFLQVFFSFLYETAKEQTNEKIQQSILFIIENMYKKHGPMLAEIPDFVSFVIDIFFIFLSRVASESNYGAELNDNSILSITRKVYQNISYIFKSSQNFNMIIQKAIDVDFLNTDPQSLYAILMEIGDITNNLYIFDDNTSQILYEPIINILTSYEEYSPYVIYAAISAASSILYFFEFMKWDYPLESARISPQEVLNILTKIELGINDITINCLKCIQKLISPIFPSFYQSEDTCPNNGIILPYLEDYLFNQLENEDYDIKLNALLVLQTIYSKIKFRRQTFTQINVERIIYFLDLFIDPSIYHHINLTILSLYLFSTIIQDLTHNQELVSRVQPYFMTAVSIYDDNVKSEYYHYLTKSLKGFINFLGNSDLEAIIPITLNHISNIPQCEHVLIKEFDHIAEGSYYISPISQQGFVDYIEKEEVSSFKFTIKISKIFIHLLNPEQIHYLFSILITILEQKEFIESFRYLAILNLGNILYYISKKDNFEQQYDDYFPIVIDQILHNLSIFQNLNWYKKIIFILNDILILWKKSPYKKQEHYVSIQNILPMLVNIKENTDNMLTYSIYQESICHAVEIEIDLFTNIVDILPNEIVVEFFEEKLLQITTKFLPEELDINNIPMEYISIYHQNINMLLQYLIATKSPNKISDLLPEIFLFYQNIFTNFDNKLENQDFIENYEETDKLCLNLLDLFPTLINGICKLIKHVPELPSELVNFIYSVLDGFINHTIMSLSSMSEIHSQILICFSMMFKYYPSNFQDSDEYFANFTCYLENFNLNILNKYLNTMLDVLIFFIEDKFINSNNPILISDEDDDSCSDEFVPTLKGLTIPIFQFFGPEIRTRNKTAKFGKCIQKLLEFYNGNINFQRLYNSLKNCVNKEDYDFVTSLLLGINNTIA